MLLDRIRPKVQKETVSDNGEPESAKRIPGEPTPKVIPNLAFLALSEHERADLEARYRAFGMQ